MADWIDWKGGECPVAPNALVECIRRNGDCTTKEAEDVYWGRFKSVLHVGLDVVAYRVVVAPDDPPLPFPA